jgi:hypothetical protein
MVISDLTYDANLARLDEMQRRARARRNAASAARSHTGGLTARVLSVVEAWRAEWARGATATAPSHLPILSSAVRREAR